MRENNGCPICGARSGRGTGAHRCSEASLRAIDGANTRALREDDEDGPNNRMSELHLTIGQRIQHGYMMMNLGYDDP